MQQKGPYLLEAFQQFRRDLRAWLVDATALSAADLTALAAEDPTGGLPDLMGWFRQHQERTRQRVAQDPLLAEVLSVQPSVHAVCLADRMELWVRPGIEPVPALEAAALIPLVRQYREARAAVLPGRGGFFSAHFWGHDEGPAPPDCNFEFRSPFKMAPVPTRDDYVADLAAFPRTERWMPDWLIEILG